MGLAKHRWAIGVLLLCGLAVPAVAERPVLPDTMPEGTLLYLGWPGIDRLAETCGDTALAKTLKEPEFVRLREQIREDIWPAVEAIIAKEIGGGEEQAIYEATMTLLDAVWRHPVAIGVIGVGVGPTGPQVDAAVVVRAGNDAQQLAEAVERLLKMTPVPLEAAKDVPVGGATLKELTLSPLPLPPLRWGVIEGDFVMFIGDKMLNHLSAGAGAKGLGQSERFATAMKITGGSADTPTFFLDIKGIVAAVESFQPMLAGLRVPVLGEAGGVTKAMDAVGLGKAQSLSVAMVPQAGGFKTSALLHAPGLGDEGGLLTGQAPLKLGDLAIVPKDASWASVTQFDLLGFYKGLLGIVAKLGPAMHDELTGAIAGVEQQIGFKIEEELLGSFGDTWAFFDAPSQGGFWLSGITLVVDVKPANGLDSVIQKTVSLIAKEARGDADVTIHREDHRGQTISFVNVTGVPMPVAPAWAQYEGRCIIALYPQMVRTTLDRMIDKGESILDNPDFQRGMKLMPPDPQSVNYVDTKAGVEQLYALALPFAQVLMAMGQGEGVPVNVSMLPMARTVTRHLFGNVSVTARTKDGVLAVSHGPLPIAVPSMGEGLVMVPLLAAWSMEVALPTEERARSGALTSVTVQMVSPRGSLALALELFRMHMGRYPKELKELYEKPDAEADAEKWAGPYIRHPEALRDPWGNEIRYRCPGEVNKEGYDLWSMGPDGMSGTDDDIRNWERR